MDPGPNDRVSIWSIVERHHLLFAIGFVGVWFFGITVLIKHGLCKSGFWPASLVLVEGIGPVTLSAISLPFALLKGAEIVTTLYEAARARRERDREERERRAREEEHKALQEYIRGRGDNITEKELIEFLNRRETEVNGATSG